MDGFFNKFSSTASNIAGRSYVFFASIALIILWVLVGPIFSFSDTWQLVINTTTTIITFLMVFIIQNTQNRESHAQQIKLDIILRSLGVGEKDVLRLEEMDDKELENILKKIQK